jgi:hypothetical protein
MENKANTVEVKEYRLKFKLEPNFLEERKIQQIMSDLAGGWEKLSELESAITSSYQRHLEHNRLKLGDAFIKDHQRYLELDAKDLEENITDAEKTELKELRKIFTNNKHYKQYLALIREKSNLYNYAMLSVLCIDKPDTFDFVEQKEETLIKIWYEYEQAKKKMKEHLTNLEGS